MKNIIPTRTRNASTLAAALASVALLVGLSGCVKNGGGGTKPTPTPVNPADYDYLSGNWEIQATPATGTTAPFTALGGYIYEQGNNPGVDDLTQAALQAQSPSSCYANASYDTAVTVPLTGSTQGADIRLASFAVNNQVLTIIGTKNSTATAFTGTYSVAGGCANGASGTVTGTEYDALTGTYTGSVTGNSGETMSLKLSQYSDGTGDGVFLVSGSATFTGFPCFTTGNLAAQNGGVAGSAVALTFTTNDAKGAQAVLTGTINPSAETLTINSITVTGGSCPGSIGAATLQKS